MRSACWRSVLGPACRRRRSKDQAQREQEVERRGEDCRGCGGINDSQDPCILGNTKRHPRNNFAPPSQTNRIRRASPASSSQQGEFWIFEGRLWRPTLG